MNLQEKIDYAWRLSVLAGGVVSSSYHYATGTLEIAADDTDAHWAVAWRKLAMYKMHGMSRSKK